METSPPPRQTPIDVLVLRWLVGIVLGILLLGGAWLAYAYAYSPEPIRHPTQDHIHARVQIIVDGRPVDFADAKYQTAFNKDVCSAALTKEPFHFHDGKDQFIHLHWKSLTGGLMLKHYGWNFIGGPDNILGYEFNGLKLPEPVKIHGKALPALPKNAKYYVFIGDETRHTERKWGDFLRQDLASFLAGRPFSRGLIPAAHAQGDDNGHEPLATLNHLIGNVVIFVQPDKPSDTQVQDRFHQLVPLPESACAG